MYEFKDRMECTFMLQISQWEVAILNPAQSGVYNRCEGTGFLHSNTLQEAPIMF
jgi:hypothetical protein